MKPIRPSARSLAAALCGLAVGACASSSATPRAGAEEAPAASPATPESRRVVAVGDLHGDLDQALETLRLAGVVDAEGRWTGGETILVQTGDITDRGPDSRALIDLLRELSRQAPASGGQVVALLGNHEAMNLTGDWRYVHPGDLAAFGGAEARRAALAPTADYGSWLVDRPAAARLADTIFVHGGIRASVARQGLDGINRRVRASLRGGPEAELLGPDGPLWFRGYVTDTEAQACAELDQALGTLQARRMVVGHTTRRDGRIQTRCGGKLHVIDIGIASAYGGHTGAWILQDGDAAALYPTGRQDLEDPS